MTPLVIEVPPGAPDTPSLSARAHRGAFAEREANEESFDSAVSRRRWRGVEIARDWRQRNTIPDSQGFWPDVLSSRPQNMSIHPVSSRIERIELAFLAILSHQPRHE